MIYKRHLLSDAITTRVLQIVSLEFPDTPELIPCQLSIMLLDRPPEHQAVSYLWGDSAIRRVILINDLRYVVKVNLSHRCVGEAQRSSTWRWQERPGSKGDDSAWSYAKLSHPILLQSRDAKPATEVYASTKCRGCELLQ